MQSVSPMIVSDTGLKNSGCPYLVVNQTPVFGKQQNTTVYIKGKLKDV